MDFAEYGKFGHQTNVYPALITHDELISVFRESTKHTSDDLMDFNLFKVALTRIAAIA